MFEHHEEALEPAVGVAKFVGAGPDAEFFEVVAHGREAAGMFARGRAKKVGGFADVAKGNQVAENFQAGNDFHRVTEIFGEGVAVELFEVEAGAEEMIVVDERVIDAGGRERRRDFGLPYAFREPCAARTSAEMLVDVGGEARDLFAAVFMRDRDEDGLVEAAADHFDLAGAHERAQNVEIFGMEALDPLEERARIVKAGANRGMAREDFDEGQIGSFVGAFDYVIKISNWLVGVDQEDEFEFPHRRTLSKTQTG